MGCGTLGCGTLGGSVKGKEDLAEAALADPLQHAVTLGALSGVVAHRVGAGVERGLSVSAF